MSAPWSGSVPPDITAAERALAMSMAIPAIASDTAPAKNPTIRRGSSSRSE